MYHDSTRIWKELLEAGLKEDQWQWDWTSAGTFSDRLFRAELIAKSEGIWAADGLIRATELLSAEWGMPIEIGRNIKDGDPFSPKQSLLVWHGPSCAVLAFERPFINLSAFVCGIAAATRELTDTVQAKLGKRAPRVTSTRKTLPQYRDLSIYGVICGGGHSHRVGLSGGVLIKENHIAAAGGISAAIDGVKNVAPHGLKIEVEVTSLEELTQAIAAGAEGVLLDNFTPDRIIEAVKLVKDSKKNCFVEVSGGINRSNVSDYAIEGVDVISVGFLTHSVKAADLSLLAT